MPYRPTECPPGDIVTLEHASQVLRGNPLGDPHIRQLPVWLPPGYHAPENSGRRYPVLYALAGFTSSGPALINWKNFGENVPQRAARLIHQGAMLPVILVFPDCFTALGGNQYINSSAIGAYADYLVEELVPYIDTRFRTLADRAHRGCFGHSSGGYGAMVHAMRYPGCWGAIANHSGDAYFDFVYRLAWPQTLNTLARYAEPHRTPGPINVADLEHASREGMDDGRVANFLDAFRAARKARDVDALMNIAMAASYDPDPAAPNGFRLPFNLETGELLEARWARWLKQDPIHMVAQHAGALKSLRGLFIDCGWNDQYQIHFGTRILSRRLQEIGIDHVYEEFDDNHSGIEYRLDVSLPYLARVLSPAD